MKDERSSESPELKQLQLPAQKTIRRALRIAGPVILAAGLVCMVVAFVDFVRAASSYHPPHLFWLFFVGGPLLFVGTVLSVTGFMGAIARFQVGEMAPVATDTVKYVAEDTKGAVETVAKAMGKGLVEGMDAARAKPGEGKD